MITSHIPTSAASISPSTPVSIGGFLTAASNAVITKQEQEQRRQSALATNSQPLIQGLAGHIRRVWEDNKRAKQPIEERMLQSLRQRRGEYDPKTLQLIRASGGSEIYMMVTATKCRAVSSWLRDVLTSQGQDKPWSLEPTPQPDLPPDVQQRLMMEFQQTVQQLQMQVGMVTPSQAANLMDVLRRETEAKVIEEARERTREMERRMEDQLQEGGFPQALNQALDDLATFPAAIIKGPVLRSRKVLSWVPDPMTGQWSLKEEPTIVSEWERVDPFDLYPAPSAQSVDDGDLIERHSLSRSDLQALIGVEGYNDEAIRAVLDEMGRGGMREWLSVDAERAEAEGQPRLTMSDNPGGLIDALQFWGMAQGKDLIDWGMDESEVPDPVGEYEVEAWLIDKWVIKAVINPDPLGRRPYYVTSYEKLPGLFWGNGPPDLIRDVQAMCNAVARALSNNVGIASGPQVWVDVDRLPANEDVTNLYPWKIHQFNSRMGTASQPPIGFFQPNSNAQELMAIYEKFAELADEHTGIPRYMTGESPKGSVGRTASGMSMLMSHAGKVMKQVIANIDLDIFQPLLERLHLHNMKYSDDPKVKGDVRIVARGMNSLMLKEAAQVRLNELLASTANQFDMQILGMDGRAALLRESMKSLDMNIDKVVPDVALLRAKAQLQQLQQTMAPPAMPGGQELIDGSPAVNHFSPVAN